MRKGWNYINFVFWMGIWYNSLLFIFFPPNEVFPLVLDFITVIWDIMRWPICINPTFRLYVPTQSGPWNWKFTWLILLWNILVLIIDNSWLNVCISWKTIILRIIWFLSSLLEFIYVSVSLCQQFIMNQKSGFHTLGIDSVSGKYVVGKLAEYFKIYRLWKFKIDLVSR